MGDRVTTGERLRPDQEALLHIETARRALADAEALLRIPRPTGLPRLRVQFPTTRKGVRDHAR